MKNTRQIIFCLLVCTSLSHFACEHPASADRFNNRGKSRPKSTVPVKQLNARATKEPSLTLLASEGRLLELRARLRVKVTDQQLTKRQEDLLTQVEQLVKHQRAHDHLRQQKRLKTMEDISQALTEGDVEEALSLGVFAYGLYANPESLRKDPRFKNLVREATAAAQKSFQRKKWITALNLYRGLNLLYEVEGTYLPLLKQVERRIRFLSMYNTLHLQAMLDMKAKAEGETSDFKLEDTPWDKTLKGVKLSMYIDALQAAHERHITRPSYQMLLIGGLDNLKDLIQTRSLAEKPDFKSLGDPEKVNRFLELLAMQRQKIERSRTLKYSQLQGHIKSIMTANLKTVSLPFQVLVYEMANGSFEQLDEFSSIIWPVDISVFNRNVNGRFCGVGIQILRRDSQLVVVSPLPGTPASRAGILPEDIISSVDGISTSGWSLDKAVKAITGEEGSFVTLGIRRVNKSKEIAVRLKRTQIKLESVLGWHVRNDGSWDMMIDPNAGVGYLRITQFVPQTADDLDTYISDAIRKRGMKSLILDLRYNPGGLLESAIDITNRFLGKGTIVSTVGPSGKKVQLRRAYEKGTYPNFPLIVLINEGSASASEIFAGAIRHYKRGLLIGKRTFGKGSVQDLFDLNKDKSARLKLTTHYYALPSGKIIHRLPGSHQWGVNPNLTMHIMPEVISDQLEKRQKLDIPSLNPYKSTHASQKRPADIFLEDGLDMELEMAVITAKAILLNQ